MKRIVLILLLFACTGTYARNVRDTLGTGVRVTFVENLGQWDEHVRFEAQLHNATIFLEDDGITVALSEPILHPAPATSLRRHAYKMRFVGSTPTEPHALQQQSDYYNYFIGNDPSRWRSKVPAYGMVRYNNIYPGIDLELFTASNALKYNLVVAAGADATAIVIEYDGADGVTASGDLRIATSVRDVVELHPYVYQHIDGKEVEVPSRWKTLGHNRAAIEIGTYDHSRELVIDPTLIFASYTGSVADNWGASATYDSHKNTYTAGLVFAIGYPTSLGAYDQSYNGNTDIGIFKFDTTGSERLYATYLGGAYADMPHSLYVNSFDELLVFGTTGSSNFPTTEGAYQRNFRGGPVINYESAIIPYPSGSDIFVCRLSADGSQLQASTFVGGTGNDGLNYRNYYNMDPQIIMFGNDSLYYNYGDGARGELITDYLNNVYVGSSTMSFDFPTTPGCVQPVRGGKQDGVVFKLDYNLRNMLWSTYLGGQNDDAVYSIDVDSVYNLLVCGGTVSHNFPVTSGAYQTTFGGGNTDGFVSKISYHGDRLLASTYVGSNAYDQLYFVRTGRRDEVLLFGQTKATGSTWIHNAAYSVPGAGMLLVRMQPDLSDRVWSTVFGTPGRVNLSPTAFAADICNRVYAAGWGRDFVGYNGVTWNSQGTWGMETSSGAYQDATDGQDFYILSLDADANTLEYATFFGEMHNPSNGGSDHVDGGTSRFDRMATLYQAVCASCGGNNMFPVTTGAWSNENLSANCNNAVFRFNVTDDFPVAEFIPPAAGCAPYTVAFNNTGRGTSFVWDFGDGTTSTDRNPTHTYTEGGIYTVTLVSLMQNGCATSDTQRHSFQVLSDEGKMQMPQIACNNTQIQIGPRPQLGATYEWIHGTVSDSTVANPWVSQADTYILRISAEGCVETDTFQVTTLQLVSEVNVDPNSCHDSVDGRARITLESSIDTDSLNISIVPPAPYSISGHMLTIDSLIPSQHYLCVVTGYGCSYEVDFTAFNKAEPLYKKESSTILCTDSCSAWIHYLYGGTLGAHPTHDTTISHLCEGMYIVRLTDDDGCPIVDTTVVTRSHTLDSFAVWADRYDIYLGESVQLHASHPAAGITYRWDPVTDLDDPTIADPTATPAASSCYTVVAVDTATQCNAVDTLCITCTEVICGAPLFTIPNAFTPNGDGINDRLCFNNENITSFYIAIFNRWGEKVYESRDVNQCWDGTFRNTQCLPGVYTYTCQIRCHTGIENDFKGDITLIR